MRTQILITHFMKQVVERAKKFPNPEGHEAITKAMKELAPEIEAARKALSPKLLEAEFNLVMSAFR